MQLDEMRQKIRDLETRLKHVEDHVRMSRPIGPLPEVMGPRTETIEFDEAALNGIAAMIKAKNAYEDTGIPSGVFECPKCDKNVRWTINPQNKHTRGKCETPDCLTWIE